MRKIFVIVLSCLSFSGFACGGNLWPVQISITPIDNHQVIITKYACTKGGEFIDGQFYENGKPSKLIEHSNVDYFFAGQIIDNNENIIEDFIGGGEESYGYLAGDFVRDKDAVMSCALIAEMVAWAKSKGKNLFDLMQEMYMEHGFYLEDLISITKQGRHGAAEIAVMMDDMRKNTPTSIVGEEVVEFIDYLESHKTGLPKSNVLQFITAKGTKLTARPSGTEPKIKFYFSVQEKLNSPTQYDAVKLSLQAKIANIQAELNLN